jgi:hypothetical protein
MPAMSAKCCSVLGSEELPYQAWCTYWRCYCCCWCCLQDCALLLQGLPAGTLGRPQEGVQEDQGAAGHSIAAGCESICEAELCSRHRGLFIHKGARARSSPEGCRGCSTNKVQPCGMPAPQGRASGIADSGCQCGL